MGTSLRAVEATGVLDSEGHLYLDNDLVGIGPSRVRVVILVTEGLSTDDEEWMRAAATSPAFEFLADPAEDVYSLADGQPFVDAR